MLITSVFTALYAIICIFLFNHAITNEHIKIKKNIFPICIIFSLLLRVFLAYTNPGHTTDMRCFSAWADMLYENGFSAFYASDAFTDYPPGYMYILRVVGFIKSLHNYTAEWESIIIKFPAMIADIIAGILICHVASKKTSINKARLLAVMYIFNPAAIINSAVWGQVDAVYLLLILCSLILLDKKNIILSFITFAVAIIFKPQSLIFTPVFLFAGWEHIKTGDNINKSIKEVICGAISALIVALILMLPFGIKNTLQQYTCTLNSYSYATINAFNIWGLFGMNWHELNYITKIIGYCFIPLICIGADVIYFKGEQSSKFFTTGAFLSFATYMLTVKMHERYAFCAVALMLFAFCCDKKSKSFISFILLTISQIINVAWVYFVYEKNPSAHFADVYINIASAFNFILLVFMFIMLSEKKESNMFCSKTKPAIITTTPKERLVNTFDIIAIAVITVVYSFVAFYNLGDIKAPQTEYTLTAGTQLDISFDNETQLSEMCIFAGNTPIDEDNRMTISFFDENDNFQKAITLSNCDVFAWHFEQLDDISAKHIVIECENDVTLREMAFFNAESNILSPSYSFASQLFDENNLVPNQKTNLNSTYFDEIYHARTAYEFINGIEVYEWTHPPLGKVFISFGIRLFGMNPFGWRFSGVVFGILMLPFVYLFSKKLFKKSWLSCVLTIAFAFDFMHFVQTRIATIDVYITFFVILMYYFMYSYYCMNFYSDKLFKTFVPLLFCGISFGFGTACKWTGIYAGAGLCVIFFMTLHSRYEEYLFAKENPDRINSDRILSSFKKNTIATIAFCICAFVIIPLIIYVLSYIPFVKCNGKGIAGIIKNQTDMFVYHSQTVLSATHPYSSKWYEWIIMKRPIWYYSGTVTNTLREGISAFGNPLVWWGAIPAVIFTVFCALIKKDKTAVYLTVGYFAQLIPWMFVDRVVFIYHYFPCVLFLVLCMGYFINAMYKYNKKTKYIAVLYAVSVVGLFVLFYPVLSGMTVNIYWVDKYLRWVSSWVLI